MLSPRANPDLSAAERQEVAAWIETNSVNLPDAVRTFLQIHHPYLKAGGDPSKALHAAWQELRRALHITPSSERRRSSGSPLADVPRSKPNATKGPKTLEDQAIQSRRLRQWHDALRDQHDRRAKRLEDKLAKMSTKQPRNEGADKVASEEDDDIIPPVEEIELTEEERARAKARGDAFVEYLLAGDGADPSMKSVNETLMPGGAVLVSATQVHLPAEIPENLAEATVVKTLSETRVRYDFAVAVTRVELEVEKKVVVDDKGERHVIVPSTSEYGPPQYAVTWDAMATLATLVAQFAIPFNRLATMFSTPAKRFTAGALARMLHYVARRFMPVYLELANQLANSEILAGDDTSCRVLEVSRYFAASPAPTDPRPWDAYRTPSAAEKTIELCEKTRVDRMKRRDEGDRSAVRTSQETPSLGALLGCRFGFESPRRNGDGPKEALHISVISGRSVAEDPQSLIVFYRSHIGSCGNLLESLLKKRDPKLRKVTLQGDMSTTNLVTSPKMRTLFDILQIGCSAHARRPFAVHEDDDPDACAHMLHLFLGLAIHEQQLDVFGRNRDNVLAVRENDSRQTWNDILVLAKKMEAKWSKATKLGAGARYIINHFDALTAYLSDPRLEPTNNMRERMLRLEKLIEGSSMFRCSLEGRFVLDVVRTILQTAVAAGVPVHEYLVSVMRTSDVDIKNHPNCFTPRAWAEAKLRAGSASSESTAS
ncbi:MAG: transposase [Kofleriaceae bacterium]